MSDTQYKTLAVEGDINIFYRTAGPVSGPVILLLHGFPSSSHQYRNLIPLLANKGYRVIAPDFPGFGFTTFPDSYKHTFENLSVTTEKLLDALQIKKFAVYIFDYGAPTALRLALRRPEAVTAIITQNGNAYVEGIADFWAPIQSYWKSGSAEDRAAVGKAILTYEATKWQYDFGTPSTITPAPEAYNLDWALMSRPGNSEIQLDLFLDYGTNLDFYPQFQEYFRKSQVPVLGVWGKNDLIFVRQGLEPFKRDLPNAELHLLDAGHFAVESHTKVIAELILDFLKRNNI